MLCKAIFPSNYEQLCAGDLGTNAEHLEHNLVEITSLAYKWGAIILIDEADVYLAERSLQDVQRNGLVSVFLRHLEYFQGIMFLTTNRLTIFDDAFQSRIHFAMKFGDLTARVKKTIWETFLRKVPTEVKISEEEMGDLSRKDINGRQVRRSQLGGGVTSIPQLTDITV
jgi:AAA+ superfamily predicted ATPase